MANSIESYLQIRNEQEAKQRLIPNMVCHYWFRIVMKDNLISINDIATVTTHFYHLYRHKAKISKLSDKSLAYDNCVYLSPTDLEMLNIKPGDKILITNDDKQQIFRCKSDPKLEVGKLGCSGLVWDSLSLDHNSAIDTDVMIEAWDDTFDNILSSNASIICIFDTYTKVSYSIEEDEMKSWIRKNFAKSIFTINEFQNVISPAQSMSPPFSPVSPNTMNRLTLENQYGHGSDNSQYGMGFVLGGMGGGNSNRNSMHAHFQGIPSPPPFRLGAFRGGSSLKLDLSEILLDDDSMTPHQSIPSLHFPVNSEYGTMTNTKENTLHNAKVDSTTFCHDQQFVISIYFLDGIYRLNMVTKISTFPSMNFIKLTDSTSIEIRVKDNEYGFSVKVSSKGEKSKLTI